MRENKFRAWNIETKCFFIWDLKFAFGGTGAIWGEVQQYTGLKDKNGKEIYEGDIVKLSCLVEPEVNKGTYWKKLNFAVSYEGQSFYPQRLNESEIVGNIHENPELL